MAEIEPSILDKARSINWNNYAQPEWNNPTSVIDALGSVARCHDGKSSQAAYDDLMFSIGNNHAGSYFPVAVPAISILGDFIAGNNSWALGVALSVLDDYSHSFYPDAAYALMPDPDGTSQSLEDSMKHALSTIHPLLKGIMAKDSKFSESDKIVAQSILTGSQRRS